MNINKTFIILLATILLCSSALGAEIPEDKAVHAILGEAPIGASIEVLDAFAHALRNRGTLQGVYGHLEAPSVAQWQRGSRAWVESETSPDSTFGATHWLSAWDLKNCRPSLIAWRHKMIKTVFVGDTQFYKEKRG